MVCGVHYWGSEKNKIRSVSLSKRRRDMGMGARGSCDLMRLIDVS